MVSGGIPLQREMVICDSGGTPLRWEQGERFPDRDAYALCRCGKSGSMPFCDGMHEKVGFEGAEKASMKPFDQEADRIDGPGISLYDNAPLCATVGFCHRGGNIWKMAAVSSDPASIKVVEEDARDCPSGRLVALDHKTGEPVEPDFAPSISIIEMPAAKLSGPLWVKGRVPIESTSGRVYEVRNRVTLCRCGRSKNMPFCDGSHISAKFNDGDASVS